jgi:hypothetical protein
MLEVRNEDRFSSTLIAPGVASARLFQGRKPVEYCGFTLQLYWLRLVKDAVMLWPPVTECNMESENLAVDPQEEKLMTTFPIMVAPGATLPTTSGIGVETTGEQAVPAV